MKKKLITAVAIMSVVSVSTFGVMRADAFNLGSLLKVGGIGFVVDRFGSDINGFLNGLLKQNGMSSVYSTKVVPILSIGNGGHVGAAQVTGPIEELQKVKAVAQVEAKFSGAVRVKGLVPIDGMNPLKSERVQGVGVSAIIDIKI